MLAPTLGTTASLFGKLERERYRALHHTDRLHKADHFYNFCITAHALRDYFLEHVGATSGPARKSYLIQWSQQPILVAAAEIANSAKHFRLRAVDGSPRSPATRSVRIRPSSIVNVTQSGGVFDFHVEPIADLLVTTSSGERFELYRFMDEVVKYWRVFLKDSGIPIRRQTFRRLSGTQPEPRRRLMP